MWILRILLCSVLLSVARGQLPADLDASYWIDRLNLTSFLPGQPYFSENFAFGDSSSELPPGYPEGATRRTSSNAYVLFKPGNDLYPMYVYPGYDAFHHVRGWPIDVHILDPSSGIMTNHTLGPREKDAFTVTIPPGHYVTWRFKPRRSIAYGMAVLTSIPEYVPGDETVLTRTYLRNRFPHYQRILGRLTFHDNYMERKG